MQRDNTRSRNFSALIFKYATWSIALVALTGILSTGNIPVLSQNEDEIIARDLGPVWSPDSSHIAFESTRSGNFDIWIYDFNEEVFFNVTNSSEFNEYNPVWVHNHKNLVFVSESEFDSDIYMLDTETMYLENITKTRDIREFSPAISIDGMYLAFVAKTRERQDIKILDLETREFANLTIEQDGNIFGLPDWYSQDNYLVFTDSPLNETTNLWLSIPGLGSIEQITNAGSETLPTWSPIEPKIATVSRRSGNLDIWVLDTITNDLTNLTFANLGIDTYPSWSADGEYIAYVASTMHNNATRQDIWVVSIETGEAKNLTSNFIGASLPNWSPTDNTIAFVSLEDYTIWIINSDGSSAHQLTDW